MDAICLLEIKTRNTAPWTGPCNSMAGADHHITRDATMHEPLTQSPPPGSFVLRAARAAVHLGSRQSPRFTSSTVSVNSECSVARFFTPASRKQPNMRRDRIQYGYGPNHAYAYSRADWREPRLSSEARWATTFSIHSCRQTARSAAFRPPLWLPIGVAALAARVAFG